MKRHPSVCKQGHDLTEPGTTYVKITRRNDREYRLVVCVACDRERQKLYRDTGRTRTAPHSERTAYADVVAPWKLGDRVEDRHSSYDHKLRGTVVGANQQYGTLQVRLDHSGETISIFAPMVSKYVPLRRSGTA